MDQSKFVNTWLIAASASITTISTGTFADLVSYCCWNIASSNINFEIPQQCLDVAIMDMCISYRRSALKMKKSNNSKKKNNECPKLHAWNSCFCPCNHFYCCQQCNTAVENEEAAFDDSHSSYTTRELLARSMCHGVLEYKLLFVRLIKITFIILKLHCNAFELIKFPQKFVRFFLLFVIIRRPAQALLAAASVH